MGQRFLPMVPRASAGGDSGLGWVTRGCCCHTSAPSTAGTLAERLPETSPSGLGFLTAWQPRHGHAVLWLPSVLKGLL